MTLIGSRCKLRKKLSRGVLIDRNVYILVLIRILKNVKCKAKNAKQKIINYFLFVIFHFVFFINYKY